MDLVAKRGETTVIIGGSGAGKTTLLRLIVALEQPTSGELLIEGQNIVGLSERKLNEVRQKFGMVYQYAALLDSINVLDNVAFPLVEHTKLKKSEMKDRVVAMLKELGLDETVCAKYPSELSGGMRKRVGMARALMTRAADPHLRRADQRSRPAHEPHGRRPHRRDAAEVRRDERRHLPRHRQLLRIAHQAILLIRGKIVARGTPDELVEGDNEDARDFIKKSGVDIKHVTRVGPVAEATERKPGVPDRGDATAPP